LIFDFTAGKGVDFSQTTGNMFKMITFNSIYFLYFNITTSVYARN